MFQHGLVIKAKI